LRYQNLYIKVIMKTKREEELAKQLSACKAVLQRERQKNRDLHQSRDKYKLKSNQLAQQLKAAESIKKKRPTALPSEQYIARHK
jgi:hypothetical protein